MALPYVFLLIAAAAAAAVAAAAAPSPPGPPAQQPAPDAWPEKLDAEGSCPEGVGGDGPESGLSLRQLRGEVRLAQAAEHRPPAAAERGGAVAGSNSTPHSMRWYLGVGYNMKTYDFFTLSQKTTLLHVFKDLPDACFTQSACPPGTTTRDRFFTSISEWSRSVTDSAKINVKLPLYMDGVPATVASTFGVSATSGSKASSVVAIEEFLATRQVACYEMTASCQFDRTYMSQDLEHSLQGLKGSAGGPYTEIVMRKWVDGFIELFGTHIGTEVNNGARIVTTSHTESKAYRSTAQAKASLCVNSTIAKVMHGGICGSHGSGHKDSKAIQSYEITCRKVGGDQNLSPCFNEHDVEKFLRSATDSVPYAIHVRAIAEILSNFGEQWAVEPLTKAVEYYLCDTEGEPRRMTWARGAGGEYGCQCTLYCHNGGRLNRETCTCECPVDPWHNPPRQGWKGADCSQAFGHCQNGAGTASNGASPGVCVGGITVWPVSHQVHSSCSDTQVCCSQPSHGTHVCPLASTCDCSRWFQPCRCMHHLPKYQLP